MAHLVRVLLLPFALARHMVGLWLNLDPELVARLHLVLRRYQPGRWPCLPG